MFPRYPSGGKENIWKDALEIFLAETEQAEDQRHLEGICKNGEKSAPDSGIAHPEGGGGIPEHERAVVVYPSSAHSGQGHYPLHHEQGDNPEKREKAAMRHKERNGHQPCKKQDKHPHKQHRPPFTRGGRIFLSVFHTKIILFRESYLCKYKSYYDKIS